MPSCQTAQGGSLTISSCQTAQGGSLVSFSIFHHSVQPGCLVISWLILLLFDILQILTFLSRDKFYLFNPSVFILLNLFRPFSWLIFY